MTHVLAIDLGASGGRVIRGSWDPQSRAISLTEVHRFVNEPVGVRGTLHWDILRLFHEIKTGIRYAVRSLSPGEQIHCLGVDTWGVDFGLLDSRGNLLANPIHYRDKRTDGQVARLEALLGQGTLFRTTGVQNAWFNTVVQIAGALEAEPHYFDRAAALLFTPDLLNYFFTGLKATERTIGSTSQLMTAGQPAWDKALFEKLGWPRALFQDIREPGQLLGAVTEELAAELGLPAGTPVALVPSHDTESAAAAVPCVSGNRFAFISCGTWAVLGAEGDHPILSDAALTGGFSNEAGAGGKTLLLKNIMGLWLLQECKRWWEREGTLVSHGELVQWAESAPTGGPLIDVNHPMFASPGDLPGRILVYCRETGQELPQTRGAVVRCIIESLACEFRQSLETLETVLGEAILDFWLVGGGTQNGLLCRLTASVTGRRVFVGPSETTALGNVLSQLVALGTLGSLEEGRAAVGTSLGVWVVEPEWVADYEEVFRRWRRVLDRTPPAV